MLSRFWAMMLIGVFPTLALSLEFENGIVTIGDRDFFVGTIQETGSFSSVFFPFDNSVWLQNLIDEDEILSRQFVRFFVPHPSSDQFISELPPVDERKILSLNDFDKSLFDIELYDTNRGIALIPKDPGAGYRANCVLGIDRVKMNVCTIYAKYPYSSTTVLSARQFFPGDIHDVSRNLEEIVERMIELAACLDVTNQELGISEADQKKLIETRDHENNCGIPRIS